MDEIVRDYEQGSSVMYAVRWNGYTKEYDIVEPSHQYFNNRLNDFEVYLRSV